MARVKAPPSLVFRASCHLKRGIVYCGCRSYRYVDISMRDPVIASMQYHTSFAAAFSERFRWVANLTSVYSSSDVTIKISLAGVAILNGCPLA